MHWEAFKVSYEIEYLGEIVNLYFFYLQIYILQYKCSHSVELGQGLRMGHRRFIGAPGTKKHASDPFQPLCGM